MFVGKVSHRIILRLWRHYVNKKAVLSQRWPRDARYK